MHQEQRHKLAFWFGLFGLLCPVCLGGLIFLMHQGVFTFSGDFHGDRSFGFYMLSVLALLPAGALCSSIGIILKRSSPPAVLGLLINLGLMLFIIAKL